MKNLRILRIDAGLSQLELAEASGVPRWAIQMAEQGIRGLTIEQKDLISAALGLKDWTEDYQKGQRNEATK